MTRSLSKLILQMASESNQAVVDVTPIPAKKPKTAVARVWVGDKEVSPTLVMQNEGLTFNELKSLDESERGAYFWNRACAECGCKFAKKGTAKYENEVKPMFKELAKAFTAQLMASIQPQEVKEMDDDAYHKHFWTLACLKVGVDFAKKGTEEYDKVCAECKQLKQEFEASQPQQSD